ncbi:MAG TPA: hypothetical protein VN451_10940 [Chitinophagaceae bacterium]|nr:hypothetical protein [Chitinophagaceae bacterium]
MKKLSIFCICVFISTNIDAQTTTGRVKWKSASNIIYTYTGELLNGKPHGRGFAVSDSGGFVQVFGEFKNGMIDGSTVVRHSNGRIVVANWKQNKPEGTGVLIWPDEHIDYGNFVNGIMEGKVISVHDDNGILIDNIKNGIRNGRVIKVSSDGKNIYDNVYVDGQKNGQGYQYETDNKTMFEGIWENGEWVRATTGNYPSFMRNPDFSSNVTSEFILIYSDVAEKDNQKVHNDTCFDYDLKNNNRWFGYFNRGEFRNGVRLIGDSLRTIGQFDEKGFSLGFSVEFKKGRYLYIGNYEENKMDGNGITVDIDDSTIYDGKLSEGTYTGSAARLMKNKEIRIGNFNKGQMEGGKIIYPDGHTIVVGYDSDLEIEYTTAIILSDGQRIDPLPKEVCTAINFLLKERENNFTSINSNKKFDIVNKSFKVRFTDGLQSWYQFPDAQFNRILPVSSGTGNTMYNEFICGLTVSEDLAAVKKKYNDLCKKLTACTITSLQKGKLIKLVPKLSQLKIDPENNRMASLFSVPDYGGKKNNALIRVMVEMNYDDKYQLTLDIISK